MSHVPWRWVLPIPQALAAAVLLVLGELETESWRKVDTGYQLLAPTHWTPWQASLVHLWNFPALVLSSPLQSFLRDTPYPGSLVYAAFIFGFWYWLGTKLERRKEMPAYRTFWTALGLAWSLVCFAAGLGLGYHLGLAAWAGVAWGLVLFRYFGNRLMNGRRRARLT